MISPFLANIVDPKGRAVIFYPPVRFSGACSAYGSVASTSANPSTNASTGAGPSAPSAPPGNPEQHQHWASNIAAVAVATKEGALPLLKDIVVDVRNLARPEDSTLHSASDFFSALQQEANSYIRKTSVNSYQVGDLPELSYGNPLTGQFFMNEVLRGLKNIGKALKNAKATFPYFASNITQASKRVGQLETVISFITNMFATLHTLQLTASKLERAALDVEDGLYALHTACLATEVKGQLTQKDVEPLAKQLNQQTKDLGEAYKQLRDLSNKLGGSVQVALPEEMRGMLQLSQQFQNWGVQHQQKFEELQLHKKISLLLGSLANPGLSTIGVTGVCTMLAGQLAKLPGNSFYWRLVETHPQPMVRQLASHRQPVSPVEKPLEAVYVRHTQVALLTQKGAAFEAAAIGNLNALHECLMKGLDPEVHNDQQETLLHVAAENGRAELIDWLANVQKLPLEATCKYGYTPFLTAAKAGHAIAMAALHDTGANKDAADKFGNKVIHMAVESGNLKTLKYCVETLKLPVNEENFVGTIPLLVAAAMGRRDIMECLMCNGANSAATNRSGNKAHHMAVQSGNLGTVKYCVETLKLPVNEEGDRDRTLLLMAAEKGRRDIMDWLISQGANIHAEDIFGLRLVELAKDNVKAYAKSLF